MKCCILKTTGHLYVNHNYHNLKNIIDLTTNYKFGNKFGLNHAVCADTESTDAAERAT